MTDTGHITEDRVAEFGDEMHVRQPFRWYERMATQIDAGLPIIRPPVARMYNQRRWRFRTMYLVPPVAAPAPGPYSICFLASGHGFNDSMNRGILNDTVNYGLHGIYHVQPGQCRIDTPDAPWVPIPLPDGAETFTFAVNISIDGGTTWTRFRRDEAYSESYVQNIVFEMEFH